MAETVRDYYGLLGVRRDATGEEIKRAQAELPVGQVSFIPNESQALRALAQVNRDVVEHIGRRCANQRIATIDLDATVIESWKREARASYQGTTGYQPMLALWAEMDLCVADEFRDGNVPAQKAPLFALTDQHGRHVDPMGRPRRDAIPQRALVARLSGLSVSDSSASAW